VEKGPVYGDATVEPIEARVQMPIHACLRGQIPEGPSSSLRRARRFLSGDVTPGDARAADVLHSRSRDD